jgi:thiol:disulfide interchange protein DsbG
MRNFILVTALTAAPIVALAAGPSCAVPPSPQEAATIRTARTAIDESASVPATVNPQAQAALAAPKSSVATPPRVSMQQPPPGPAPTKPLPPHARGIQQPLSATEIDAVPALQRIASAGATLLDLGTEHGLRTIFAMKADAFQVFYLVPDGSAAVGGVMWDASGHDVTRDQVAPIPGVIPTIKVGPGGTPAKASPVDDQSQSANPLSLVKETTYGTLGAPDAAQLWMFVDPFCSFSVNAMRQLAPYVQSGKVRLSVIPLSVLDYEDQRRSTPAAKVMVSAPKDQMVADWLAGSLTGTPSADAAALLGRNMAIAGGRRDVQ